MKTQWTYRIECVLVLLVDRMSFSVLALSLSIIAPEMKRYVCGTNRQDSRHITILDIISALCTLHICSRKCNINVSMVDG